MTDIPHLPSLVREAFASRGDKEWPTSDGQQLDRSKVLNASEIGKCIRQIGYAKEFPAIASADYADLSRAGYAERGHAVEAWVVQMFHLHNQHNDHTSTFFRFGENQRSVTDGKLSATPDAILLTDDLGIIGVDVKSIDPRTNWDYLPKKNHVYQVKAAAHLLRLELGDRHDIIGSIILYMDASNFNRMGQHFIPYDEDFAQWAYERHEKVFTNVPSSLTPEGIATDECKTCAFASMCNKDMLKSREGVIAEAAERAMQNVFRG